MKKLSNGKAQLGVHYPLTPVILKGNTKDFRSTGENQRMHTGDKRTKLILWEQITLISILGPLMNYELASVRQPTNTDMEISVQNHLAVLHAQCHPRRMHAPQYDMRSSAKIFPAQVPSSPLPRRQPKHE